ncbi:PREDICTED: transmembrane and TPR repeat-containing protein 4-like isoform X1 [Polistes dominula]|uniref:dolichyl-phosphate-mannose--protein mannosyltransferase n=1 Tax=Polistes dominula TaxID=743375 RepID=A0ABM1JEF1_POLDO|nr:PREDICTED: transmembrane and TPR repeat-containing protein 4-like isoform X1 [Polistes dominula]
MAIKINTELPGVPLPVALLIIIILSLCYANSYNGVFVFDDAEAIVNNDDAQKTPIWKIFKNDFWGTKLSHKGSHKSYRPLTVLTFRIQYWIRGHLNSQDFHIANIILHIIVSLLTYYVFNILLSNKEQNLAFYGTVLFTIHPVHTEAISGIVGRAELLCLLFMWLSLIMYNQCIIAKHFISKLCNITGCITSILIAMLCKETGITAIGICIVYDLVIINEFLPNDILKLLTSKDSHISSTIIAKLNRSFFIRMFVLCLSAIMLLSLRFTIMEFSTPKFQPVDNPASFVDNCFLRFINYSYIYSINMWLLICPVWLCFDWSMGCIPLITGYDKRIFFIILFWMFIGTIIVHIFSAHKDRFLRCTIIGLALLVVPFLPASNIFFTVGFVLAERTLYIPSAGYCLLVVIGLQKLLKGTSLRNLLILFYTFLCVTFFIRSWNRSDQWRSEESLFRSALDVCPLNAKVHYNIAKNAADAGNLNLAKLEYEEALRLNPKYPQAMNNLANLLKDEGKYDIAENLFKQAVTLQKDFATAWMNYGIVLSALKRYEESERSYLTALSQKPKYPDCYYNLGVLYLEQKHYHKALMAWTNATKLKVTHRRAWTNMVILLDDLGMSEEALKIANEALQHIPDHASIYFNIANILGKLGRFLEAETYFKQAISRNPIDSMFYTNLGVLYHRWNKVNEAEYMYKKALEFNPHSQSAKENLKKLQSLKRSMK